MNDRDYGPKEPEKLNKLYPNLSGLLTSPSLKVVLLRIILFVALHCIAVPTSFVNLTAICRSLYLQGQMLHARVLGFRHPMQDKYFEFDSLLPEHFTLLIDHLRRLCSAEI
jgi:hypothetical protein